MPPLPGRSACWSGFRRAVRPMRWRAPARIDGLGKQRDGQVFTAQTQPGAGGQIAAQLPKAAPPDGATIMLSIDHTQVIIPLTVAAAGYHPVNDFTALAGVAKYYNVL